MSLPVWLYLERNFDGMWRVRRFGSRRPLRVVLTVIDGDETMSTCVMGAIGRLGMQVGPEDGLSEGFTSMPKGSKCKLFPLRGGLAIGLTWEGSRG